MKRSNLMRFSWQLAALLPAALLLPAIALAQDSVQVVVPVPTEDGLVNTIGAGEGGILYAYIGLVFRWAAGLVGALLLLAIIYYGFLTMFAGLSDQREEAKKGIAACVGGIVLLMSSGLLLYTLNPSFFGGFGGDADGGAVIGEGVYSNEPLRGPTTPAPGPATPGPGTPPGSGTSAACANVPKVACVSDAAVRTMATNILGSNFKFQEPTISTPRENLRDIAAGNCPNVQSSRGGDVCEGNPEGVTKQYVGNLRNSLGALDAIRKAGTTVEISALYGGQHSGSSHRQLRSFDLTQVDGKRLQKKEGLNIPVMTNAEVCAAAQKLRSNISRGGVAAPSVIWGPVGRGSCSAFTPLAGHSAHFHLQWNSVSAGAAFAPSVDGELSYEERDIPLDDFNDHMDE